MRPSDLQHPDLEQLPQFPAIATKVLRLLSREDTSLHEIGTLVKADAGLASAALRLANSALFATSSSITSIERALALLGLDELKRMVLAVSMHTYFQSAMRLDLMRGIWRHSLACAMICDELSVACSPTQSRDDAAYTAGLLHNLGRLGLFVAKSAEYSELLATAPPEADLLEREQALLGLDHCQAGAYLAEKWELPETVMIAAAHHHDFPEAGISGLENLVKVGVLLSENLGFDIRPPANPRTLQEVRAFLPRTAQMRFDPKPDELKARIIHKLDSYD